MRFRSKSLTGLLYAVLLAIPLISVVSKVIYVQSNKNAYLSAGITEIQYEQTITERLTDYTIKENYYYYIDEYSFSDINGALEGGNGFLRCILIDGSLIPSSLWTLPANQSIEIYLNFTDYTNEFSYSDYNIEDDFNAKIRGLVQITQFGDFSPIDLVLLGDYFENANNYMVDHNLKYVYTYDEIQGTTLDNVFEYALDKVIQENNFGKIDFFSYFTGIFMNDNAVNNRYIGYVNYYLNYALMVSLAYLLFLMLMWFVNFARRFLDRGMNYDW